jgi:hypothetical protein
VIASNGFMALADGAAQQFAELLSTLVLSMLAYVVFKACEYRLVHSLSDTHSKGDVPSHFAIVRDEGEITSCTSAVMPDCKTRPSASL